MNDPLARLHSSHVDGTAIVRLSGEIDLSNSEEIAWDVDRAIAAAAAVVVDLSAVAYMDSQAVRLLHDLARRLRQADVPLSIVAPTGTVAWEILDLTRLTELVPVLDGGPRVSD